MRGLNKIKTRSAKAKGKSLEKLIQTKILEKFPELKDEIRVTIGQEHGSDLKLSKKALEVLPIKIEAKSRASMSVYTYYEQAKSHHGELEPIVIVKMNRRKPLIVMDLEYYLELIRNNNG